ncbi:MAG TPA: efflux RND transporter periplasmic adaptor subunit [Myxococcales bacterium]|nr:efflux RND transporter periplasmic adaptor subunit [Myxococcales bacterium]
MRVHAPVLGGLLALAACQHPAELPAGPVAPKGEVWLSTDQVARAQIQVEVTERKPIAETLVTGGKVAFDDLLVSHVFSPVSGRVTKIEAQLGETVKKNQPLAYIDSPDLGSAYSDLVKAQADLTAAQHDVSRQRDLLLAHAASEAVVEQSEDNYRKAQAEMERAKLKISLLHASHNDIVSQQFMLRSPIDGEVIARNLNPGTEIQGMLSSANIANELFTIGDLSRVWMLADVYEIDIGKVHPGDPVTINSIAYPGETFRGKVDYVSDVLDPATRTAHLRVTVENPDKKLKPEMYVTATVTLGSQPAISLPRAAVLRLGDQSVVFVQTGKTEAGLLRFRPQPVTTGKEGDGWIEVTHGLQSGEPVVTQGGILLSSQV